MRDAHVARLEDDLTSWQKADELILHGFRYDRTTWEMPLKDRLTWLAGKAERKLPVHIDTIRINGKEHPFRPPYLRPSFSHDFDPQPYTHLARVLHDQGRRTDAAKLLEERDKRVHCASRRRVLAANDFSLGKAGEVAVSRIKRVAYACFGTVFGYGHRPGKAVLWVALIIGVNWALYSTAYETGQMAPTSDVVLASEDWKTLVRFDAKGGLITDAPYTLTKWQDTETAQDYTTFNPALYALDLFIPLDALGQEEAWAPSPTRGIWGKLGFWTGWLTQMAGWLITAITAAALTGFVGRKD